MTEMELFAVAARLHVVMRRVQGRVTDVEWMTRNREYAREVIRIAREQTDQELLALADKLEACLSGQRAAESSARRAAQEEARPVPVPHVVPETPRYVGRLR